MLTDELPAFAEMALVGEALPLKQRNTIKAKRTSSDEARLMIFISLSIYLLADELPALAEMARPHISVGKTL